MRKIIISLAPVKAGTPIDADALAWDVEKSVAAGAAMCHLHCRTPEGALTDDIAFFAECFDKILARTDVIVQTSTGGVSDMNIKKRCLPLSYSRTESASLNGGTTNLGESVYINTFDDIRYCAKEVYNRGIIPEVEVFDIGMIHNIEDTAKELPFRPPILYNLVFGHKGGMQPTIANLIAFRSMVPPDACWSVTHYGRKNWEFLAAAIAMGAIGVRIGFEDSPYLDNGREAEFNYQVVSRLTQLLTAMELAPATCDEARAMMHILTN